MTDMPPPPPPDEEVQTPKLLDYERTCRDLLNVSLSKIRTVTDMAIMYDALLATALAMYLSAWTTVQESEMEEIDKQEDRARFKMRGILRATDLLSVVSSRDPKAAAKVIGETKETKSILQDAPKGQLIHLHGDHKRQKH